jgi:GTP cyclohydrolase I
MSSRSQKSEVRNQNLIEGIPATPESLKLLSESYTHFCRGYKIDAAKILRDGRIPAGKATGQTITVAPIHFYSLCEHHLLPFFGTVEITYVANKYILGLGKFPRVVEALACRLWMQENLTTAITDALAAELKPKNLSVTLTARHLCLEMRGAQATGTQLTTRENR